MAIGSSRTTDTEFGQMPRACWVYTIGSGGLTFIVVRDSTVFEPKLKEGPACTTKLG